MVGAFLMPIFRKERECVWEYLQVFLCQEISTLTSDKIDFDNDLPELKTMIESGVPLSSLACISLGF